MLLKFLIDLFSILPILNNFNWEVISEFWCNFIHKCLRFLLRSESQRKYVFIIVLVNYFFRKNNFTIRLCEFLDFLHNSGRFFSSNKNNVVFRSSGHLYFHSMHFFLIQYSNSIFSITIIFILNISSVEFIVFNFIKFNRENGPDFSDHLFEFYLSHLFWKVSKENIWVSIDFLILLLWKYLYFVPENNLSIHLFQSLVSWVLVFVGDESKSSRFSIEEMSHYFDSDDVSVTAENVVKNLFIYFLFKIRKIELAFRILSHKLLINLWLFVHLLFV